MPVEVQVKKGASERLFKLQDESKNLKDLRTKIESWVGGNFYFLKGKSEIDPNDEDDYLIEEFKSNNTSLEIEVKLIDSDTKADRQAAMNAAQKKLEDTKLTEPKLDPKQRTDFQQSDLLAKKLIKDENPAETNPNGTAFNLEWDKLSSLLESFNFPEVLRVQKEELKPVTNSGLELKSSLSQKNVKNQTEFKDDYEAYETKWEQTAYKMGCKNISASLGIPIPKLSAMLGIYGNYPTSSESQSENKQTHLYMVAERIVQKLKVSLKKQDIQVTEEFKSQVEKAVNAGDVSQIRKVFRDYGYLVPTEYIIGGKIFAEETITLSGSFEKTAKSKEFGSGNFLRC